VAALFTVYQTCESPASRL